MEKRFFLAGVMRLCTLFYMVTFVFFLFSCNEKTDPWKFDKPSIVGNELPITQENIIGTWNIYGLYSEQKDMTGINPSLRTGYLILRSDDSCFFRLNEKMESHLLKGVYNTANIDDHLIILEMKDSSDVELPKVQLTINKLTDRQMDADYLYYDYRYGKGESNDSIRLLADFNFNNGSLSPDYYPEDISVTDIELTGISKEQRNDTTMSFTGFLANVNNQNSRNLYFKLKTLTDEKLAVDSFYIKGYRIFFPERDGNSKIQFCTSSKTNTDFILNNGAVYEFPRDNSQSEVTLPAASMALGDSIYVGISANILGSNGGYLFINELSVYGKLILGEKFLYNYVFEKQ